VRNSLGLLPSGSDPIGEVQRPPPVSRTECDKLNIAAIGNKVPQLHQHIIARTVDDAAWPEPVWGQGTPEPYDDKNLSIVMKRIKAAIKAQ